MADLTVAMCLLGEYWNQFGFFSYHSDRDGDGPCNLQGALRNSVSTNRVPSLLVLKWWSLNLARPEFLSLYFTGLMFPFYPLTSVPEIVTMCAVLFKYIYSQKQINREANKEKMELCRPISLPSKSERWVGQVEPTHEDISWRAKAMDNRSCECKGFWANSGIIWISVQVAPYHLDPLLPGLDVREKRVAVFSNDSGMPGWITSALCPEGSFEIQSPSETYCSAALSIESLKGRSGGSQAPEVLGRWLSAASMLFELWGSSSSHLPHLSRCCPASHSCS